MTRGATSCCSGRKQLLVQRVLDHRDPHLLGPPLRPDPQSYSALSDYLLPTPTLLCGIISAIVLMLFPRWLRAPSFDDAVTFFYICSVGFNSSCYKRGRKRQFLIDTFVTSPPEPLRVTKIQTPYRTRLIKARANPHERRASLVYL